MTRYSDRHRQSGSRRENQQRALRRIYDEPIDIATRIVSDIGPRRGTSLGEARAAAYLDGSLRRAGLNVSAEVFHSAAWPVWDTVLLTLLLIGASAIFYWRPSIALVLALVGLLLSAYGFFRPDAALLARRRESQNVVGTFAHEQGMPHRIVVLAPLDSPPLYAFSRYWLDGQRAAIGRLIAAAVIVALMLVGLWDVQRLWLYLQWLPLAYLLVVLISEWVVAWLPASPGAVSYAGALAALIVAAEELGELEQVELWLVGVGVSSSEDGLRDLLRRYPFEPQTTIFIELGGLGSSGLAYITREGWLRPSSVDPELQQLVTAADRANTAIECEPRPFLGPPTMAHRLRRQGWRAVTLVSLASDGQVPYRATAADTLDILDANVLDRAVRLLIGMVRQRDRELKNHP